MKQTVWHFAGASDDFTEGMHPTDIARRKVVVARIAGELYAFNGYCPHVAGPMHRGELNGSVLTCPLHGWRFDLGQAGCEIHGYRPLDMYEVKEENGAVYVAM
jgi:nitrite reductase/ring-hydroxylating ferredoxin subunit